VHVIEDDIKIITPIVQFWGVGLLQGILDCEWMEAKARQNGEAGFGWFVRKIHPQKPAAVFDEFGKFLGMDFLADGFSIDVVKGVDHFYSRIAKILQISILKSNYLKNMFGIIENINPNLDNIKNTLIITKDFGKKT